MIKQEINEIKNEIKSEPKRKRYLENLTILKLRCIFCGKPYDFKKDRELRLSTKEKINKIERLKEEVERNEDELLDYVCMYVCMYFAIK